MAKLSNRTTSGLRQNDGPQRKPERGAGVRDAGCKAVSRYEAEDGVRTVGGLYLRFRYCERCLLGYALDLVPEVPANTPRADGVAVKVQKDWRL
jgi:hypothetical protein